MASIEIPEVITTREEWDVDTGEYRTAVFIADTEVYSRVLHGGDRAYGEYQREEDCRDILNEFAEKLKKVLS